MQFARTPHSRIERVLAALALFLGLAASPAWAAPLDEARSLYEQQNYVEVDGVLEDQLQSGDASAEALMLSYRANREAGRMVTADRRITLLLERTQNPDTALIIEAARAAERAGSRSVALSRFLLYANQQKNKTPELREALVFLSRHGTFPEQYRRFIEVYGADDQGWHLGSGLLQRLLEEGRPEVSLPFTEFLLEHYHNPNQVEYVEWRLRHAADRQLLGRNAEQMYVRPIELVAQYDTDRWDSRGPRRDLWNRAIRHMSAERRVELLFQFQTHHDEGKLLPWHEFFHDFRIIDRVEDHDRRHELSKKFLDVFRNHLTEWEVLEVIRHSPGAFRMDGRVLIDAERAEKLIDDRISAAGGASSDRVFDIVRHYIGEHSEQGLEILARHAQHLKTGHVRHVLVHKERRHQDAQKKAEKEPTPLPAAEVKRVYNNARKNRHAEELVDLHRHLWGDLHRIDLTDELWTSARRYVLVSPDNYDADWAVTHIFGSDHFPQGDRLSLLEELATKAGKTDRIDQTFAKLAEGAFQGNGRFNQIQNKYKRLKQGQDPLTRAIVEMAAIDGRNTDKSLKIAKGFLDQRDASEPLPASWWDCDSVEDMQAFRLLHMHRDRTGHRGDDRSKWAAAWLPHLKVGWAMDVATQWADGGVIFQNVEHILSQLEGDDSNHARAVWKNLGRTSHPRDNTDPIFADHYAEMGPETAVQYLMSSYWSFHHSGNDARRFFFEQLANIVDATDFAISRNLENSVLGNIDRWVGRHVKAPEKVLDGLIKSQLARRGENNFEWHYASRIHQYFHESGHGEAAERFANRVLDAAATHSLEGQIYAIETFLSYVDFPAERSGTIAPGGRYHIMVNRLAPLYDKLPEEMYASRGVRENLDDYLQHGIGDHFNPDEVALSDEATQARETLVKMRGHLAHRLAAGADFWGHDHAELDIPRNHMVSSANRGQWLEAAAMASHLADRAFIFDSWGHSFGRIVNPSIERLMQADGPEIAFALIRRIEGDYRLPEEQAQQLSIAKAQAAREIPNLISVPKSDPTYDIHLAAHQLTLGNETRAWALTRPKLDRLRESWQQFDPAYVAWTIDQMRKQKQLEPAMDFAMNVLLEEKRLTPAVAAEVSLAKADIFRDLENYQAARVEYESLMASDRYKGTAAGEEARYRLIELLIITRDYGSAEQMLARMEDSPDPRTQAEAYYYYARIAYEQEDYKQAADYLKQVRDRVMNHVEAAFLEGELALVLPGGLRQTEVQVGNPELATVAIPGRELTLKLQDPNLSIARGNASIPVVVQTTRSGDVENIELMPSATTQNTFSGTIPTALGTPEKDNLRLELRGDDQVTYNIAPAFQEANDLDYAPKVLEVKADARLVASSGEILSTEEQEQRELQRQMAANRSGDERHWAYQNDRVVRPGNPIHVQVDDADRDLGPDRQTVTVDLETSSGDRIRGFELTETGPHDAIFRGSIPTGLPLPTARASDSFEGSHPADAINSSRNGVWSSLPDGNAPKWIEVDTMSSYEVRAASIQSPDLDRVLQVRLLGSLGGDFEEIAAWPVGHEERGLTATYFKDKGFQNQTFQRTDTSVGLDFGRWPPHGHIPHDNFSVRWTGYLIPEKAGEYTLHLNADDNAKLWLDGEQVLNTPNHRQPDSAKVQLENRPHEIRIDMVEGGGHARMRLEWEGPGIERQRIPSRVFIPEQGDQASRRDGLRVHADSGNPGAKLSEIRRHLMRSGGRTYYQSATRLDRRDTPWHYHDDHYVARMTGAFFLPESRVLELKMTQGVSRHDQQHAHILIDGRQVFSGRVDDRARERTFRVPLERGVHELEIATLDRGRNGAVELSYRTDEGTFEPLPADWFSVEAHPELARHVMPKAEISFEGDRIVANMNEPERLRTLRWVFESFSGNQISVSQMRVLDTERNRVIPVDRDFREGLDNDTLEIAPGDEITVTYNDVKRLDTDAPTLASSLNARYFDGNIRIVNEVITTRNGRREIEYNPARRFSVGDQLAVLIEEYDADLTSDADTLEVVAESSSGGRVTLQALEQHRHRHHNRNRDTVHSGRFLGVLKTGPTGDGDTLAVEPGDRITVRYLDRENTDPGVPSYREYSLYEGGERDGDYFVYRTRIEMVEDDSIETRAKLRRLERKRGEGEGLAIYREQVIATHPDFGDARTDADDAETDAGEAETQTPAVSSHAPLLFELRFPALAKHSRSEVEVKAVSQSELDAARAEGRMARVLNVPAKLVSVDDLAHSKGYPIRLRSHVRRGPAKMLEDGVFAGIIRLQIGSPGDPVNDLVLADSNRFASQSDRLADPDRFRVPTLVVSGSDVVHLKYEDPETGKAFRQSVQLRADARLELMERSFTARDDAIHLGEAFHVRVIDPDQDATDERDTVTVRATAPTGDALTLELSETHAHSGEFTASFTPAYAGAAESPAADATRTNGQEPEPAITPEDDVLHVNFGNEVVLTYQDPVSLTSGDSSAGGRTVTRTGRIYLGADGELASFTKKFADPEMAVKTSFLTAEAMFELAKQYRELDEPEKAQDHIAEGKMMLEEALEDYPDTTLKARGDFLLANLEEELNNHHEAVVRYSQVIRNYPDSEFASRSQFKKGLNYEKLERYEQATEAYVRTTYIYPDETDLVAKATVRLARYYYQKEKYDTAGSIFSKFQERNPNHAMAAMAGFLAADCHKQMGNYRKAAELFDKVVEAYPDNKSVRSEAMYWRGHCLYEVREFVEAYRAFKNLTWEYPETKWAKIARGRLTDTAMIKAGEELD